MEQFEIVHSSMREKNRSLRSRKLNGSTGEASWLGACFKPLPARSTVRSKKVERESSSLAGCRVLVSMSW